jgi:hypothetical protein
MALSVQNTNNKVVAEALTDVQQELIRGEGLSKPMEKRSFFLPLMVQMVAVGEETGNLDNTLATVAETYEVESDDRTAAAVGLIQPIMTIASVESWLLSLSLWYRHVWYIRTNSVRKCLIKGRSVHLYRGVIALLILSIFASIFIGFGYELKSCRTG